MSSGPYPTDNSGAHNKGQTDAANGVYHNPYNDSLTSWDRSLSDSYNEGHGHVSGYDNSSSDSGSGDENSGE